MSSIAAECLMVAVFKTNVVDRDIAKQLIDEIEKEFVHCRATFDLEDCDRVLVVRAFTSFVDSKAIIDLLSCYGCDAQVLPD